MPAFLSSLDEPCTYVNDQALLYAAEESRPPQ